MLSFDCFVPWMAGKQPDRGAPSSQGAEKESGSKNLLTPKGANAFEPVKPDLSFLKLTATINDVKSAMTQSLDVASEKHEQFSEEKKGAGRAPDAQMKIGAGYTLSLSAESRALLQQVASDYDGVNLSDIQDFSEQNESPDNDESGKALSKIFRALAMNDHTYALDDTFFVLQLLQQKDALDVRQLKGILGKLGRQEIDRVDYVKCTAQLMNSPGISEPLLFELASAFVEINSTGGARRRDASVRSSTVKQPVTPAKFDPSMRELARKLQPDVRERLASYKICPKSVPQNPAMVLRPPDTQEAKDAVTSLKSASGDGRVTRPPIARPSAIKRPTAAALSKAFSSYYPSDPTRDKVDMSRYQR